MSLSQTPFDPDAPVNPTTDKPVDSFDATIAESSLAEVIGWLLRYPRRTAAALNRVFDGDGQLLSNAVDSFGDLRAETADTARRRAAPSGFRRPVLAASSRTIEAVPLLTFDGKALRPLILLLVSVLVVSLGILESLHNGGQRAMSDLFPGALLMLGGVIIFALIGTRVFPTVRLPPLINTTPMAVPDHRGNRVRTWIARYILRFALAILGIVFMAATWTFNRDNSFTLPGVICWLAGIISWVLVFSSQNTAAEFNWKLTIRITLVVLSAIFMAGASWLYNRENRFTLPDMLFWLASIFSWVVVFSPQIIPADVGWKFVMRIVRLPGQVISFRVSWTLIALLAIMIVGGYFRFYNLVGLPAEMTSDHVEKLLDSYSISQGLTPVFLSNNGGREVVQFYTLALMHNLLGLPFDHTLLKLLSGLEGMLGVLAVWWLGQAIVGDSDRELGNLTGLVMAALLAVSYWQLMLSRLGLRIVLTPFIVSIILVFFLRALRYNRIGDFIRTGLLLGIGLYMYQAVRMVPILLIVGLILALLVRARGWQEWGRYLAHFTALVIVAAAVFVPLGRYWQQYPNEFWSRTSGRLFGDDVISAPDPTTGALVNHQATLQDRLTALKNNIGYFGSNMVNSVLMFTFSGDHAWISGDEIGSPELDALTGGLFLVGLGLWLVRMVRRRDPGDWLIPFGLVVMLFPTALSLAYTVEVPSATRASGTIPMVYLLAGFAGALIIRQGWRTLRGHLGQALIVGLAALILIPAAASNWYTYFGESMPQYKLNAQDHREAGQVLRGFEQSTGAPGNAFMISYHYWWDHRALALEAGDIDWRLHNGIVGDENNTIANLRFAIRANIGSAHEIRPDRQLLFFLNQNDTANLMLLQQFLPPGTTTERIKTDSADKDYVILIAPPVGCAWLNQQVGPGMSAQCVVGASGTKPSPTP